MQPSYTTLIFPLGESEGETESTGTLVLDATLEESTELTCAVSKYAVEAGASESDNITAADEELTLSGVIVGAGASAYGERGRSKLIAAKDALRALGAGRKPITIVSGMDVYTSMGMSRARIQRGGGEEKISVDLSFSKILVATTREADVPQEKVKPNAAAGEKKGQGANGKAGATKASGGTKNAQAAAPSPKEQSLLSKMTKGGASVTSAIGL